MVIPYWQNLSQHKGEGMKKILVLFKTHLDVGYTGLANDIVEKYNQEYIPKALQVAEDLAGENVNFIWITGSWLIWQYLNKANPQQKEKMEKAIKNRWISWHGLPVTFHSEAMNDELYTYGLSLAKELDHRYDKKTIACKNTDVPGHTIGIVPHLARAGMKLLHIGVNPASMPPDVPNIFRWKAPTGEEITVIYNKGYYGDFFEIPNTDFSVYFAHTNDNMGPQSATEIKDIYKKLKEEYPDSQVITGDLNDLATIVGPLTPTLPVVEQEIGDTWIHGLGTDPKKISILRDLQRLAKNWSDQDKISLYEDVLLIPEHTWGLCEKTFLSDHFHYSKDEFNKVRKNPNYILIEKSWEEQRSYLTQVTNKLSYNAKKEAEYIINNYYPKRPLLISEVYLGLNGEYMVGNYLIEVNLKGSISKITKGEKVIEGEMFSFIYELFSEKQVLEYGERYMSNQFDWALEDFGKIGLSKYVIEYATATTTIKGVYKNEAGIVIELQVPKECTEKYGCPRELLLVLNEVKGKLIAEFIWKNKDALRIPEALWLKFNPSSNMEYITKIGTKVYPQRVVSNGNRENHFIDGEIIFGNCKVVSLDTGLISIGEKGCYAFYNKIPSINKGIYFNLFNNQWGTNFPMWYSDDAKFRFEITI